MRVLITTPTFPPFNSGLGNAVQRQAQALTAAGFEVVVATGGAERASGRDAVSGAGVEWFQVTGADYLANPTRGDVESYRSFLLVSRFDVVLMNAWQNWATDICLKLADRIVGRKLLFSHCISTDLFFWRQPVRSLARYLLWRPYRWRLPVMLRRLDGMIALANAGCDARFEDVVLANKLDVHLSIIPNALSEPAASYLDSSSGPIGRCEKIIAVGSYDWLKGHDFVLRAYAASKAKNRIPLRILGQTFTSFTDGLRRLANKIDINQEYISFGEGISGVALFKEIASAKLFISGSHTECQPLVLLDAMAAGTPFVARSTGCISGLPGGQAVSTERQAAEAIDTLLADEQLWFCKSQAGQVAARHTHHPDIVGRALINELNFAGGKVND